MCEGIKSAEVVILTKVAVETNQTMKDISKSLQEISTFISAITKQITETEDEENDIQSRKRNRKANATE